MFLTGLPAATFRSNHRNYDRDLYECQREVTLSARAIYPSINGLRWSDAVYESNHCPVYFSHQRNFGYTEVNERIHRHQPRLLVI